MKKTILILLPILLIGFVLAQNETCTNESCSLNEFIKTNITVDNETASCPEQLEILLDEYNNLTVDYHSGANCGTIRYMLIDNNQKLSDNLKTCNKENGKLEMYKLGFYFCFVVLILVALYWIFMSNKTKVQEAK